MKQFKWLKILLIFDVLIILFLIFYRIYSFVNEPNFSDANIKNIEQIKSKNLQENYSFAVIGDINNSFDIFDHHLAKKINDDKDLQFLVSTGNAVMDGEEDKYRILNKSLQKVQIPTVVAIGQNEYADGGAPRFYSHYGSYYFTYTIGSDYFLFLDTTNNTAKEGQKQWLIDRLKEAKDATHIFVFMNKSPIVFNDDNFRNEIHYIDDETYRNFLTTTFSTYHVTAVFSSNATTYVQKEVNGVDYYVSGGGGGTLSVEGTNSFYHYVKVNVTKDGFTTQTVKQEIPSTFLVYRLLQNTWIYIHSVFYFNYIYFFLILCLFTMIAVLLYMKVNNEVDFYRRYDLSEEDLMKKDYLNIAMFTNNYLPFIGGVPISIYRLAKGLVKRGHHVYIFAPKYINTKSDEMVIRCKLLLPQKNHSFVVTNIFSLKINQEFKKLHIDVVHIHHPFWMGKKGLHIAKRYHLPVVFTYHTRLEHYAHFLPVFKKTFKNIVSHKMIYSFAQKCDGIIAPTVSAEEYLSKIGVSRHKLVMPTGIDFDVYQNEEDEIRHLKMTYQKDKDYLFCTVSRLSEEKNIHFLIEGLKYIKEHSPYSFKCLIIGKGDEEATIKNYITDHHLEDTIELLGAIPFEQITKFYQASDLFVFCSKSETQGMVVLEAMAGSCPVVAINSSGIDDVIQNGINGFKTNDDLDAWTNKIMTLMASPDLLKELSQNALLYAKHYSIDEMSKEVEKLYQYVISYKQLHDKK